MKKKNIIISSFVTIALCLNLLIGSTFALFTSESKVNIAVTSGKVNVVANVDETSVQTKKLYDADYKQGANNTYEGVVTFNQDGLTLEKFVAGDGIKFNIVVNNESNVTVKYRTIISCSSDNGLFSGLNVSIGNNQGYNGVTLVSNWDELAVGANDAIVPVTIELPETAGNTYQEKTCTITYMVEAIQGNAKTFDDTWDGTSDASWYNDTDTEFTISTAEQFAGLAQLVDGNNNANVRSDVTLPVTFEGKTIKLEGDFDFGRLEFNPIGHSSNGKSFKGTFDGQGHTLSNIYMQSNLDSNNGGWLYEGEYYGLFAYTNGATIKNVNIDGAYISSGRNEAACVVGNAKDTTFSNINITNSTLIAYNNSAGGVASECYGNCSFENITVDENTVIGPLWGTYDVRLGGIVGLVHAGNEVSFKDITVACKLDAINDVAANYQYWLYRYCGMLIGHVDGVNGVADPTGYVTCENVKVIYNDWVNYHYCEFEELGAGSYNGPGEYKYARVEAGTGTNGIDISSCNHSEDESHNVLIVFDQLFGGGQGIAGLKTYDGVTVYDTVDGVKVERTTNN